MRFEEFGKGQKPEVRFRPRCELDQEIYVALSVCLAPQDRAKQGEPDHTQGADLPLACRQPVKCLLAVENWRLHGYSLSAVGSWIQMSEGPKIHFHHSFKIGLQTARFRHGCLRRQRREVVAGIGEGEWGG